MTSKMTNRLSDTVDALRSCNESLRVLTDKLAKQLDSKSTPATTPDVLSLLEDMLENLTRQFALEERHGYLADVLEQFPSWHPQVEHLRQQHGLLTQQLREMRNRVAESSGAQAPALPIRRQLVDWINTYNEHEQRETALIQDSFTLEPGVGE